MITIISSLIQRFSNLITILITIFSRNVRSIDNWVVVATYCGKSVSFHLRLTHRLWECFHGDKLLLFTLSFKLVNSVINGYSRRIKTFSIQFNLPTFLFISASETKRYLLSENLLKLCWNVSYFQNCEEWDNKRRDKLPIYNEIIRNKFEYNTRQETSFKHFVMRECS